MVHNNISALRRAVNRYNQSWNKPIDPKDKDVLGICHRFEEETVKNGQIIKKPVCAIVRLAPPYLSIDIVAHELAHAAVWIRELEEGETAPLNCHNDEEFCWLLGELVCNTMVKLYEHKLC